MMCGLWHNIYRIHTLQEDGHASPCLVSYVLSEESDTLQGEALEVVKNAAMVTYIGETSNLLKHLGPLTFDSEVDLIR